MTNENPYRAPSEAPTTEPKRPFLPTTRYNFYIWLFGMLFTPMLIGFDEKYRFLSQGTVWIGCVVPLVTVSGAIFTSRYSIPTRVLMWIGSAFIWCVLIMMTLIGYA